MKKPLTSQPPATSSCVPLLLTFSPENALATIARVERVLAEKGWPCRPQSALGALFAKVRRMSNQNKPLNNEQWRMIFLRANEGARIARAIEAALEDPGSKEAIHRVTSSDVNLSTRQKSQGKDSLWELDLYRRFKLGDVPVRFEEPDLVISLGNARGEYGIACKKVYSELNVPDGFRDGCRQLTTHRRKGIVAFNLDDLTPENLVWQERGQDALRSRMEDANRTFVNANKEHFIKAVARGDCDGILVCTSVISEVRSMSPPINVSWSTAIWSEGASPEAKLRVTALRECLDRAIFSKQEI